MDQITTKEKSTFVTVLAWVFIVLSSIALSISIFQNIMINATFPFDEVSNLLNDGKGGNSPTSFRLMFNNLRLFSFLFFATCLITLESSIGLLKRMEWARITFIIVMGTGVVWNLGTLIFSHFFFKSTITEFPISEAGNMFNRLQVVMNAFMLVFGLGVSGIFGFIIYKLTRSTVKKEFRRSKSVWILIATLLSTTFCVVFFLFSHPKSSTLKTIQSNTMADTGKTTIFIASLPPVAEVYMDSVYVGKTNIAELQIRAGSHYMSFVKDSIRYDTTMTFTEGKNGSVLIRMKK